MTTTPRSLKSLSTWAASLALLLMASANLYAQDLMAITLKGDAEVPPVMTAATGTVDINVTPDHKVSGSVKVSGLVPTIAHIHEAATGQNGPPIVTLSKTGNDSFVVPVDATLTDAQYVSYLAGNLYVNVHSANFPNGELRAQLLGKPMGTAN